MADASDATERKSSSSSLYEPCIECKKKRTLCIRVRRPTQEWDDFGHAALSVEEPLSDGWNATTTYGNWSGRAPGDSISKNDEGDDFQSDSRWKPNDVRCKEIDEEQEKKLKEELSKPQTYSTTNNNCATWAGRTYNNVAGDNLSYGNYFVDKPSSLLESMESTP